MKGLWLLPSRRRIEKLRRFLALSSMNGMTSGGAIMVQKDEHAELETEYAALPLPEKWGVIPMQSDGMGDKYREIWPAVKDLDWVGIACDDLQPQTPGWDAKLLSRINGRNVVTCNDGQQGDSRMSGITVFSGGLLRAIGYIYAPGFWHTFMDNVWEDVGRATGCWTYEPDVLVTHDHPFVNQQIDPAKADETTYKSYGRMEQDRAAYIRWREVEFQPICERIKALG